MLSAISIKIYEFRRYLVLSLVISMMSISIAEVIVIERDRNRNEMYGEAFWIYGFEIYNMYDYEVAESLTEITGVNYTDGEHTLPEYLNVTYEYPVFGLVFFAIATAIYPGAGGFQPLWLNFILVLVFNLNLVLIAILLREKVYTTKWARIFFASYYIYGLIMSAGGGKLEPIVDCLFLMALVLRKEGQMGKSMFTLGLSVQTKIYSAVALPLLFIEAPLMIVWFLVSTLLTIIPFTFLGASFDTLLGHFLNSASYAGFIVNPIYPGLAFGQGSGYIWPPALVPLAIYIGFALYTLPLYLPKKEALKEASWMGRLKLLVPLYVYLLPSVLFIFRWVMPWYLFWLGPMAMVFQDDEQAIGYMKEITIVGLLYAFGTACNWPYFINGPLPDFFTHFRFGWYTLLGLALLSCMVAIAYAIWKKEVERRERKMKIQQAAEARGELLI